ncbi:hypothetical protein [Lutibacter sp.]
MLKINTNFLYKYALVLFLFSATIGLLMRYNAVFPITSFGYKNFLQGHSHVAFLGWGYIATILLIYKYFISSQQQKHLVYKVTLPIVLISTSLMLISFPLGGYKIFSIILLSIFGITTYVLSFRLLNDVKTTQTTSSKFIRYGIYYYLLSSLATWFIAYVTVTQGKTNLYYNTIYFYLHFLYNGYFVFVLFGLLFKVFEKQRVTYPEKWLKNFFLYLNIACIPAYLLSVLWSGVSTVFYAIAFIASLLQVISLIYLLKLLKTVLTQITWNFISKLLLKTILVAYILKIIAQLISVIPFVVQKSLALKPYLIIGYLHLFTLVFMSTFLFLLGIQAGKLTPTSRVFKWGIFSFLTGVFCTEILLFLQGFFIWILGVMIPNYHILLLGFSFVIVLGIGMIFISTLLQKNAVK